MGKKLLIVESPTKVRTIKKFLGKDFDILASMGHIIDLPENELGIDIDNNFKPKYKVIKGKNKIIKEIQSASEKAEVVFLGPDPDREGEAIAWHISNKLKNKNYYRVTFNEITKKAIESAIANPGQINMNLVNAQQARRLLDRIVGYKISPFLWKTVYKGLSAGRVQSVALRMICEREEEIRKFVPEEYWTIEVEFYNKENNFIAKLVKHKNKKIQIKDKFYANNIVNELKTSDFIVSKITKTKRKKLPPLPFKTSTLQQEASRKLSFSPKKTMLIAQQLYEGIELGNGQTAGLITYMRTDSTRINDDFKVATKNFIHSKFGSDYVGTKNSVKKSSKKNNTKIQDAHEAIRPTSLENDPEKIKKNLTKDQYKVYSLIWKRFLASQMSPAQYENTSIEISAGDYLLTTNGSRLIFDGFMKIYEIDLEEKEDNVLPHIDKNEKLKPVNFLPEQHFTKPPPRYNEASLIKEMEEKGIGRPSTYAQIVSTILERKYVELKERKFIPTEVGEIVNKILIENFSNIINIDFTSRMEADLDKIESGEINWIDVLKEFYTPFSEQLEKVNEKRKEIKSNLQKKTEQKCPQCGGNLIIKWGKYGRFLACENFPSCKYTEPLPEEFEKNKTDLKCPKCNSPLVIKTSKYGRFLACSTYPQCKFTSPLKIGVPCPEEGCDGEIIERQSKRGKVFYSCSNYPECKFSVWNKPVLRTCPNCGYSIMLEIKNKKDEIVAYQCYKCKFKEKNEDKENS